MAILLSFRSVLLRRQVGIGRVATTTSNGIYYHTSQPLSLQRVLLAAAAAEIKLLGVSMIRRRGNSVCAPIYTSVYWLCRSTYTESRRTLQMLKQPQVCVRTPFVLLDSHVHSPCGHAVRWQSYDIESLPTQIFSLECPNRSSFPTNMGRLAASWMTLGIIAFEMKGMLDWKES